MATAQITAVRFVGYRRNEDISLFRWRLTTGEPGQSERSAMIAWAEQGNEFVVAATGGLQRVAVVRPQGGAPFLCAHADGRWTDALLDLPMF